MAVSLSRSRTMTGIRIAQINAQRSSTVLAEIRKLCEEMKLDIVCIQEPYTRNGSIPHMPVTARVIKDGEMPMAAIVVLNRNLKVLRISQMCNDHTVCVEVTLGGKAWIFVNSYFQFSSELDLEMFRNVGSMYYDVPVVYMADANAKSPWWFNAFRDQKGEILEEFIAENKLVVENRPHNPPTYTNRAGASSNIDVTLSNYLAHDSMAGWRVGDGLTSSDHNMIYFDLFPDGGIEEHGMWKSHSNFNFRKADYEKLRRSLMVPTRVEFGDDVDRKSRELTVAIRAAMRQSIPIVTGRNLSTYRPWTDRLQKLRGQVRRARRIYQRTRVETDRQRHLQQYRILKEKFKQELRQTRMDMWQDFVERNLALDPWGVPYKLSSGKLKGPEVLSTLQKGDGSMTRGWKESAKLLLDELLPADDMANEGNDHKDLRRSMIDNDQIGGVVYPFAIEEVALAIREQKPKKAAGPDKIKAEVLHQLSLQIAPFLTGLYNECLLQGRIPSCFKEASVVVLSKGEGRDPKLVKSYRPICLLNTLGKVQERLLCKRLREQRVLHGMAGNQFGFRKGKSTEDAINFALETVSESNHKYMVAIFVDIAGAFDNLWWPFLFSCLRKMNCPRSLYLSLQDYCKGRKVQLQGSDLSKGITKGCPQGSILGPEFWDIGLEPLLEILNTAESVKLTVAYADDLLLLVEGNTRSELEHKCKTAVDLLATWCKSAKLKVAASKTTYMFLKGSMKRNPIIKIDGKNLSRQVTTRYLGVHIDEKLSFSAHVELVRTRAERVMMKLARIGQSRFYLPSEIIKLYHNSIAVSMMGYAAGVWAHRARLTKVKQKLRRTQRKILVRLVGAFSTVPTMALLVVLGLWPLDLQVRLRAANYWLKRNNGPKVRQIVGREANAKRDIRRMLLEEWQREWDTLEQGRRVHEIFPCVKQRLRLKDLQPGRGLVQYLTGHGPYGVYLHRIHKARTNLCSECQVEDTPEHALFECAGTNLPDHDTRLRLTGHKIHEILSHKSLWKDLNNWSENFSKVAQTEARQALNEHTQTANEAMADAVEVRRSLRLRRNENPPDDAEVEGEVSRDMSPYTGDKVNRRRIYVQTIWTR